jgi:uncharacterized 2Fe-2S/4Fe-4S cluster protein (DUF4445 family)
MENKDQKKYHRLTIFPFDVSIMVADGTTLWDAVRLAGMPLRASCGGEGTCGGCVVRIKEGKFVSKPSSALSRRLFERGYVQSCQTKVQHDLVIELPHFQGLRIKSLTSHRFIEDHKEAISGVYEIDPAVKWCDLHVPSPTLEDNYSDLKRLKREFQKKAGEKDPSCAYDFLKKLARILRTSEGSVRVVYVQKQGETTLIDILPGQGKNMILGVACDIGTSTVALHLVDLQNGHIEATASSLNQQIKCGEDIISRINYCRKPGHLEELRDLAAHTINNLIDTATQKAGVSPENIYHAYISGNTTMIHLLLKLDPQYIREEPYVPTFNELPLFKAWDLGLKMNREAIVGMSPAVGSYVGGDITAGLLCTPVLKNTEEISMFIDAGTNGELVVGNKEWLMTCACSAGPAFEGSGIKCGMPATEGAIEKIEMDAEGFVHYSVIGGEKPRGLCGSGLVDLLSELFVHGILDRNGKFKVSTSSAGIVTCEEGPAFLVEKGPKTYWGRDLLLTERDIVNLLRTKGAVYSACSLLLKNVGLRPGQIDSFYLAGGFGQHLSIENAVRIGLLPDLSRERFHYIGNSSLAGAYLILISNRNRELAEKIAQKMTYVELNTEPRYMNEFTGSLFLPHTDIELFPSVKKILGLLKESEP